jgi:hypothetical protein
MSGPGYTHRGTCASVMSGATRRQALLTTTPNVKSPEHGLQFSVELDPTRGDSAALLVYMGNGESFASMISVCSSVSPGSSYGRPRACSRQWRSLLCIVRQCINLILLCLAHEHFTSQVQLVCSRFGAPVYTRSQGSTTLDVYVTQ